MIRRLFVIVFLMLPALAAQAKVKLPALFADGMVMQRGQTLPVWGWASPGESVTVRLGKSSRTAVADSCGCWRVDLPAMKAGGPFELSVGDTVVHDVMVGDVWLCSGQSNIDVNIERVYPQYPAEIDADDLPLVRLFRVENVAETGSPLRDVKSAGWLRLNKRNAWGFSAVGYFLGKRMFRETGVAQGVIQSSWGGTPIEAWLPIDSVARHNPGAADETMFYRDDRLVADIGSLNKRLNDHWHATLDAKDPGIAGRWADAGLDDSRWTEAGQYDLPVGGQRFCGSYWLRQHISIDAAHAGKAALLRLGTLYDADFTYLNGQEIGRTYYQYPPRRYRIPEGLLREGDNVLTVRFVNKNGRPAFIREKPYRMEFSDTDHQPLSERWLVSDGAQMPPQPSIPLSTQCLASALWNGMLRPLAPYALSGVVWYQGEANTGRPAGYQPLLSCLMRTWRGEWQRSDMPFAVVQLANYMAPSDGPQPGSSWARLRESQRLAVEADAHAGLAVAIDIGETVDIHPLKKKEVAERCALVFDRLVYGKRAEASPSPVAARCAEGAVVIAFDRKLREGAVRSFEAAGADGVYRNVEAVAKGNTVTLLAAGAVSVRYAWKDNPIEADCRSLGGDLPAVPFQCGVTAED